MKYSFKHVELLHLKYNFTLRKKTGDFQWTFFYNSMYILKYYIAKFTHKYSVLLHRNTVYCIP